MEDLLWLVLNEISLSMSACQRLQVLMLWLGEMEAFVLQEPWGWATSALHSSGCRVVKAAIKLSANSLTDSLCLARHCRYNVPSLLVEDASANDGLADIFIGFNFGANG